MIQTRVTVTRKNGEIEEYTATLQITEGGMCQRWLFDQEIRIDDGDTMTMPGWHVQIPVEGTENDTSNRT